MSTPLLLSKVQYSSTLGAMNENGTSTRLASRAALPTLCSSSENRVGLGGASRANGYLPKFGSRHCSRPSFQIMFTHGFSSSFNWKPDGRPSFVSYMTRAYTPHRAPLLTMLIKRRSAASLKLVGKLATTRIRNGSATSPAIVVYSSIVSNSLRRYFWLTFPFSSWGS